MKRIAQTLDLKKRQTATRKWKRSVHMSQVALQAGAYPSFRIMKRQGVFLLPPGWDVSSSQDYPKINIILWATVQDTQEDKARKWPKTHGHNTFLWFWFCRELSGFAESF